MSPSIDNSRWQQLPDGSRIRVANVGTVVERYTEEGMGLNSLGAAHPPVMLGIDATEGAIAMANELGLDITAIRGTGKDGRITKWDVDSYLGKE